MGRGKAKVAVLGAHAWAYMRRDPDYRAAWALLACDTGDVGQRWRTRAAQRETGAGQ